MPYENMLRRASVAIAAAAYVFFVEAACPVEARTPIIAGSPTAGLEAPHIVTAERIVLHGVRFQPQSDKIDKCSVPILDYAVQILKRSPESFIYVKVRPGPVAPKEYIGRNSTLTDLRMRAIESYFEQRRISASRLVLLRFGGPQSLAQSFEVQLYLASKFDPGTGNF